MGCLLSNVPSENRALKRETNSARKEKYTFIHNHTGVLLSHLVAYRASSNYILIHPDSFQSVSDTVIIS
jgi:hypothetical protein